MPTPPIPLADPALLLAWAARLRDCAQVAHEQARALRGHVDRRGLNGPAGDALAQLGATVAMQLAQLGERSAAAADDLLHVAHQAVLAHERARP